MIVRTAIRLISFMTQPEEENLPVEEVAPLYRKMYDTISGPYQFLSAYEPGEKILIGYGGTISELLTLWKAAGLTEQQIRMLPFWNNGRSYDQAIENKEVVQDEVEAA